MVCNPEFRLALKRTWSAKSESRRERSSSQGAVQGHGIMPHTETDRLLNGNGDSNARRQSTIAEIFNRNHTLGEESNRLFVRWPARGFTITKITLLSNYVNVLLVFVPVGIIAGAMGWNPTAVFILNFFAIIPLAAVLSFATEEISMKLGETMGGLLNATFGNAVELIVSIVALKEGQIRIVQSSMLGSILSNILLVLGCCFIAGGIHNTRTGTSLGIEQEFSSTVASTMSSLMAVASASLIIPATLFSVLAKSKDANDAETKAAILLLSRGTAIILLILYVLYLVFQLKTHSSLFDAEQEAKDDVENRGIIAQNEAVNANTDRQTSEDSAGHQVDDTTEHEVNDDDASQAEEPQMSPFAATVVLIVVTVAVAICAEYLVNSIDSIVATAHISKTFIGLILLPIVGNAAEHVTAVVVALKDKMDLAMGVAIGSSMQIALLVTPFLVILGWIIDEDMTLNFKPFETVVFFLSVLVVTYVIADGKSNYLEGAMLLGLYIIIALAFLVYPDDAVDSPKAILLAARSFLGF